MATQRWTDEMLDNLADEVRQTTRNLGELRDEVEQTTHNIDILIGAINGLLQNQREQTEQFEQHRQELEQQRLEFEQYRIENDQRFNTLLEEVRFLIRQLGENR